MKKTSELGNLEPISALWNLKLWKNLPVHKPIGWTMFLNRHKVLLGHLVRCYLSLWSIANKDVDESIQGMLKVNRDAGKSSIQFEHSVKSLQMFETTCQEQVVEHDGNIWTKVTNNLSGFYQSDQTNSFS
jgi:hypothetical protein